MSKVSRQNMQVVEVTAITARDKTGPVLTIGSDAVAQYEGLGSSECALHTPS